MWGAHGDEAVDPILRVLIMLVLLPERAGRRRHEILDQCPAHQSSHRVGDQDDPVISVVLSEVDAGRPQPLGDRFTDERVEILRVILYRPNRVPEDILIVEPRDPDTPGRIGMEDLEATIDGIGIAVVLNLHEPNTLSHSISTSLNLYDERGTLP